MGTPSDIYYGSLQYICTHFGVFELSVTVISLIDLTSRAAVEEAGR